MAISLEHKFVATGGRPTGFDYLRLFLACSVICLHSVRVSYGWDSWLWVAPFGPFVRLVLPMFFAMGGFLIASSLQHTKTLGLYIGLRVIRIYPALFFEVVLSAFILGAIYTTDPLKQYFTSHAFFFYLMNVTGIIHFYLPGVFLHNPDVRFVNVQLWTVPFEIKSIALLAGLLLLGVRKRRILAPIAAFALMFGFALQKYRLTHSLLIAAGPGSTPGPLLMICFLFGASVYLYKDCIPYSFGLFAASLIACLGLNCFASFGDDFVAPLIAYMTAYIGLMSPKKISILKGSDYSYGLYLYGYPIQQTFVTFGNWTHHWYVNILFCLPTAALFAIFSWHCIEKPALGLKSKLVGIENLYLAWKASVSSKKAVVA